ncbi:hypothetical protein HYS31_07365 [Candidatus Woesearchaeota archaeon]|nr:hypothetical protein [Candidatus Woesearchaeota archaeon]
MSKETKIKVEAEVITNKNVSSGIGKGFGITIGIFLGLLVIGLFFGILISSNASTKSNYKNVEYAPNQVFTQTYKEPDQQRKIVQENPGTLTNKIMEQKEEFKFSPNSFVATQNGISISLDNYTFVKKGDDWGKIVDMTVTVLNKGNDPINPKALVVLHDDNDKKDEWIQPKAEINFDTWSLAVGDHITKKVTTNIAFNEINLTKRLTLVLTGKYDFDNSALVALDKDIKFN